MAVNVPSEEKIYTTTYYNFKGVDYTNDATNVFKARSPIGKNMLPDIDGKPYKRSGWKIEVPVSEFQSVYATYTGNDASDIEIIPDKAYYFELGGKDHIMIFNNLGLFKYCEGDLSVVSTEQNLDSRKAFFFEGRGEARFYFFVGQNLEFYTLDEDGDGWIGRVIPKVPVFLIGCDPSGTGTINESINMLTRRRTVQYWCDGATRSFVVPSGYSTETGEEPVVNVRDPQTGAWIPAEHYTATNNVSIDFSTSYDPPAVVVDGEDNLQVTYTPSGTTRRETDPQYTSWKTVTVTKKTIRLDVGRTKTNYRSTTSYSWEYGSKDFTLANLARNQDGSLACKVQHRNSAGTDWVDCGGDHVSVNFSAYSGKLTVKGKKALFNSDVHTYSTSTKAQTSAWSPVTKNGKRTGDISRTHTTTETKTYRIRVKYTKWVYESADTGADAAINAFFGTTRAMVFGNGIINQIFLTASTSQDFNTRVWYSAATDPTYFPDTNYVEVGATDKPIKGLIRVGEYLGIIKQGSATETSIYLAYPTSFENETTYAVKQNVNGIGAISNGAFNILNDEPLFLSAEGVMGIEPAENEERKLRSRSHYINKKLCSEDNLESAISFVHDGMYWLAVNNHCYVLDGSQKSSWANTRTNLQYECYYLENIPAQCFAKYGGQLWFTDFDGNLCRFKDESDTVQYSDDYATDDVTQNAITASVSPTDGVYQKSALSGVEIKTDTLIEDSWDADVKTDLYENGAVFQFDSEYTSIDSVGIVLYAEYSDETYDETIDFTVTESGGHKYVNITAEQSKIEDLPIRGGHGLFYDFYGIYITYISGEPIEVNVGDIVKSPSTFYTVVEVGEDTVTVQQGVPIEAVWGTIADDDGSAHYFKNLQKKGCMVSLLPSSDSGVEVWIKKDSDNPVKIGETDAKDYNLPFDFYMKKKVKKYKRLQIICRNDVIGDSFGVDKIIKSYTFGNYSKNRG